MKKAGCDHLAGADEAGIRLPDAAGVSAICVGAVIPDAWQGFPYHTGLFLPQFRHEVAVIFGFAGQHIIIETLLPVYVGNCILQFCN